MLAPAFTCTRCGRALGDQYVDLRAGVQHVSPTDCVAAGAELRRMGVVLEWRGSGKKELVLVVLDALDALHARHQIDLRAFGTFFHRTGTMLDPVELELGVYEDDGAGGWKPWTERAA